MRLVHQTAAQFATRFREKFRNAEKMEAAKMATFIMNKIESGEFTDAQIRGIFGLTLAKYTTLKEKLAALRDTYNSIETAKGE